MTHIHVTVGLGALVEELFFAHHEKELAPQYRRLHEVRRRILQEVEEEAGAFRNTILPLGACWLPGRPPPPRSPSRRPPGFEFGLCI